MAAVRNLTVTALAALAGAAWAYPPASPLAGFGPNQAAAGLFFDHSGQDLFTDPAGSVLNTAGLNLDYGPLPWVQVGAFAGAAEFDVEVPRSRKADTSVHAFDTDYSPFGGVSAKVGTPRWHGVGLFGYGSGAYIDAKDKADNEKLGFAAGGGGGLQARLFPALNLAVGLEYYLLAGQQKSPKGSTADFANTGNLRGLVGLDLTLPPRAKGNPVPFLSLAFRPGTGFVKNPAGRTGDLGLRNASVSLSFGVIADLPGRERFLPQAQEGEDE